MIESNESATSRLARHRAAVLLPIRFTNPVHDASQALELQQLMRCLWWCWLNALANFGANTTDRTQNITHDSNTTARTT